MRDEDKPYVCYRQSKWLFQITPRNAEGWRGLGLWMLPFFAATAVFVATTAKMDANGASEVVIGFMAVPFLLGTAIWAIAMIRWMLARSEIIDTDAMLKIKREQDRAKKKSGR